MSFQLLDASVHWNWCKDNETRPIMDGFRKNNVNYWVFSKIRSIIRYSLICALKPFFE